MMALEALKILGGFGESKRGAYVSVELLSGAISVLPLAADPSCPACSEHPSVDGRTDRDYEAACEVVR
jgi:hypothetical protein